jgi:hypothetical protein
MTAKIFISYRRSDSQDISRSLYEVLRDQFGHNTIFIDIDSIAPGKNFVAEVEKTLARCRVVLAVISPHWLDIEDEQHRRRLENPDDFVRIEIETALRYASSGHLRLIPLLIGQTPMPSAERLPEGMKQLVHCNALRIHQDSYYKDSIEKLIEAIQLTFDGDGLSLDNEDGISDPRISPYTGPLPSPVIDMKRGMDKALADELQKVRRWTRGHQATDGQFIGTVGGQFLYSFSLAELWEPQEDVPVTVQWNGRTLQASVVSSSGTKIRILAQQKLPDDALREVTLTDDPSFLLEMQRKALRELTEISSLLGPKVFKYIPADSGVQPCPEHFPGFKPNPTQKKAIEHALGSEVSYIIGPPGTGKTATLAAMASQLLRQGKQVLITAHTNIAVDNAILKVAEMNKGEDILHNGGIVRFGAPKLDAVRKNEYIYPPNIAKRQGRQLNERKETCKELLEEKLALIEAAESTERQLLARHRQEYDALLQEYRRLANELQSLQQREQRRLQQLDLVIAQLGQEVRNAENHVQIAKKTLSDLTMQKTQLLARTEGVRAHEKQLIEQAINAQKMRRLARIVKRVSPARINEMLVEAGNELDRCNQGLLTLESQIESARKTYSAAQQKLQDLQNLHQQRQTERNAPTQDSQRMAALMSMLPSSKQKIDGKRADIERTSAGTTEQKRTLKSEIESLSQEIANLDEQLSNIEKNIIERAQVIATTLSKTYMNSALQERYFDVVIIDEVSIAPLSAVYLVASHAIASVIVIGDPCQLPPIAQAETPEAKQWLKRDIFAHSSVTLEGAALGISDSRLLKEQFRMNPSISIIPRKHVYDNHIVDGLRVENPRYESVAPVPHHPLVLCDTSDENPRAGKPTSGSSRFNEYHKVCVLDIVQQILRTLPPLESLEEENARIGIVTPYREQANRIAKLIKAERLEKYVRVGTVHTFQGLEFETVIFDTVDSVGVTIRREFTGEGPRSGAMRLINVAITRAQHKLIIVANTRYLKEQQRQGYLAENATLMAAIQEARKAYTIMSHALLGMNFAGS